MVCKIISGGQTGADQGGLEAGRELGLQTGGTAPLGWMTEAGPQEELLKSFGLVEAGIRGYPFRTKMNVINSGGTVIFGDFHSPGTKLTVNCCDRAQKPLYRVCRDDNPIVEKQDFLNWLAKYSIDVLNVAGNRESKNSGIQERVRLFLVQVLQPEPAQKEFFGMKYPFKECARPALLKEGYSCLDCSVRQFCEAPEKRRAA